MAVKLAQIFDIYGKFPRTTQPSNEVEDGSFRAGKASVYLKRVGTNYDTAFDLASGACVIDATNFSSVDQYDHKFVLDDRAADFTGAGYMRAQAVSGSKWARLSYPVKTDTPQKYNLYLRFRTVVGAATIKVYIDGVEVDSVAYAVGPIWSWATTEFVLPDTSEHILSVAIEDDGGEIDKLYINKDVDPPALTGPDYSASPFVTIHLQVYETASNVPTDPLFIYDAKTTLAEVIIDDWYNFRLRLLDPSISDTYSGRFALVMTATGTRKGNFVLWEMVDNDEYAALPSAIRVIDA